LGGTAPGQDALAPAALTSEPSAAATLGPGAVPVKLRINGKDYRLDVEPRVTLLDAMRDHLGLTGTKRACNHGECGACTVLADGRPIYACTMLALAAQGKEIATIEALASEDQLDPLQAAFVKHDALQCGFCTPGFVMALKGVLLRNPHPSADEVRLAIAGNLCPCGTYPRVLAAAAEAAKASESESHESRQSLVRAGALEGKGHFVTADKTAIRVGLPDNPKAVEVGHENDGLPVWDLDYEPSIVGQEVPKLGAADSAAGQTKYTSDVGLPDLPGLLHAKQLWLSYPLTGWESVDIAKAQALPGVKAIIAIQPVPAPSGGPPGAGEGLTSLPPAGRPPLPRGEVLAAVAAETEAIAEDALHLIEVKYAPLVPARLGGPAADANQEMRASVVPAQEGSEGTPGGAAPQIRERGNVEQAFQGADLVIHEGAFQIPAAYPVALEPSACVAAWEGGSLTIWATTREVFTLRNDLTKALDIPASHIRVIAEHVGDGFGAAALRCATIAARLAKQAARPVKLVYDRGEEAWLAARIMRATLRIKIAARKDGTLHAIDFRAWGAAGAGASAPIWMIYRCPNVRTEEPNDCTDEGWAMPARASGLRQGTCVLEQAMDELACQLQMDPLEFRCKNFADHPFLLLEEMCQLGAEKIGWHARRRRGDAGAGPLRRGLGVAVAAWPSLGASFAQAMVRIYPDGSIEVVTGAQDLGAGTGTVLGMIAAEELGVTLEKVKVSLGDTATGLAAPPSGEGRMLSSLGVAVRRAARDAKQKLSQKAAVAPSQPDGLVAGDGASYPGPSALRPPPWAPEAREMLSTPVVGYGESAETAAGRDHPAWAVQFVDVSVDTETGLVNVNRVVSLVEAGRVMNRLTFETAIIGGTIMGLSVALSEGQVVDRRMGRVLTRNMRQTRILGAMESPPIEAVIIDAVSPGNSLGVKGLGDLPMEPTAAAVANAVAHALGMRLGELSLTPARILPRL
jgi:CO/xanthine dehydrogenase Mo-binding subunit/aerobic-type carbon monoxide dehydrogenase small subunit (CoxS/CutS family)